MFSNNLKFQSSFAIVELETILLFEKNVLKYSFLKISYPLISGVFPFPFLCALRFCHLMFLNGSALSLSKSLSSKKQFRFHFVSISERSGSWTAYLFPTVTFVTSWSFPCSVSHKSHVKMTLSWSRAELKKGEKYFAIKCYFSTLQWTDLFEQSES